TRGRSIDVRLDRKVVHELDGSERRKKRKFEVGVLPGAITVCVPVSRGRVPFLVLVAVSLIAGQTGAYLVTRDPFGALVTEGATGFSAVAALRATPGRDDINGALAARL